MKEVVLLKCDHPAFADEIVNELGGYGITSNVQKENSESGITVTVPVKDYNRALALVTPVIQCRSQVHLVCPKCGSEEVVPIIHRFNYGRFVNTVCLLLLLLPGIYVALPQELGLRSEVGLVVAAVSVALGVILCIVSRRAYDHFKCRRCGKSFHRL